MAFRTKLDYSDNRQIKQRERTSTILSGTTVFGVPFSALTSGPDLTTTAQTSQFFGIVSSYSGNSATTVFTWGLSNVSIVEPYISPLTPSNSGVSQNIGAVFASSSSTIIDGNLVNLTYSGVSAQNLYAITMSEPTPGNYTGTVSTDFFVFSAGTLDFTGRTIWIDNTEILRTKRLIVSDNPQPGYVLTSNLEGEATWQSVSAITSGTTFWSASTGNFAIVTESAGNLASGDYSVAEGYQTTASGDYSHAEGFATIASGDRSHSEGNQTTAGGLYSHSEGSNTRAVGFSSHAEGELTIASGDGSHAEGNSTTATGNFGSHAEGNGTTAAGDSSHAEGNATTASGPYSHAEGQNTTSFSQSSHAEGYFTSAVGLYSHAEGGVTIANGAYSHSEGANTTASANFSHAEGSGTIASGNASHAEGAGTTASGQASHAEGNNTRATANNSHAEGVITRASGVASHAEGSGTTASGLASHAGGSGTVASGTYSFVHGLNSRATASGVVVLGNNITGSTADTVYVPDLVIDGLTSTDPIATDANGKVVAGTSDIRLKKNITDLPSALDVIKNLRGVAFEYTEESNMGSGIRFGFIAQEVKDIVPELVRSRPKSDGMLNLNYSEIIPWIVEAIKELTNGEDLILQTQTVAAEDNNIELNYNGTKQTSIGGGISIINGVDTGIDAEFKLNQEGSWVTNNSIAPLSLIIPERTPTSSSDNYGKFGDITRDENYLYIKGNNGWKRLSLESF